MFVSVRVRVLSEYKNINGANNYRKPTTPTLTSIEFEIGTSRLRVDRSVSFSPSIFLIPRAFEASEAVEASDENASRKKKREIETVGPYL